MPIKPADQQRLDTLFSDNKATYAGRREDYFPLLYLKKKFDVEPAEVAHQVAFGNNDYGIDAYYLNAPARNLYLFQFKWTEDHMQFKPSMERLANDGIERIFGGKNQDSTKNDILSFLRRDLNEHREVIEKVFVHFIFKGDPDAVGKSEGLSHRKEDIENKSHLVRQFFGREVAFRAEFIADRPQSRSDTSINQTFRIRFAGAGLTEHEGRKLHVGFVRLTELYEIHQALSQTFFDRNIRAGLSKDNAPNRKLREAFDRIVLKEVDEPSVFAFRHNGITIAADRVERESDHVVLHVPRLLNGAQTVTSLGEFFKDNLNNALFKRNRDRLDSLEVLAKIVEADPASDFVTQVTISNNQQNPVPPWALRAMDRRQVDLADKFRTEAKLYYSRQEGAFSNLSEDDLEELGVSDKDLGIRPMAMTFLAVQGELGQMKKPTEVFENQKLYESTFKSTYLNVDARAIVLAYKVSLILPKAVKKLRDSMPAKLHRAAPASRNLTHALLIQALLNHPKYESYLDNYSESLTKESDFADIILQLTGTRILPLIKDLCGLPSYKSKADDGVFEFLRTTEVFKRAMDLARDRFHWSKKSF